MERIDLRSQPLDLDITLSCGQAFRWYKSDGIWRGVVRDKLVEVKAVSDELQWRTYPENDRDLIVDYFRLGEDVNAIYAELSRSDDYLANVIERFSGLRILRQDPTEALLSYVCSTANNIPRIMTIIEALCAKYGRLVCERSSACYYAFPTPQALTDAHPMELRAAANMGFRGQTIHFVARTILDRGEDWPMSLRQASYETAKAELMSIKGIGAKIADCVLLFSLDKHEAVPVDTHVKQIAESLFMPHVAAKSMTDAVYRSITDAFSERYGQYAGWAQEFLYYEDLLRTRALGRGVSCKQISLGRLKDGESL